MLVEVAKSTGRLTGSLSVNAFRTEQGGQRGQSPHDSWNFPVSLNLRYPLNDKFYATSASSFEARRYEDTTTGLSNYSDFAEGIDGFYVYTSKLDLLAGYRIRLAHTDAAGPTDHNFSLGATGRLLPKVDGLVRFGYQVREVNSTGGSFHEFSALGQLTWTASRKLTVVVLLSSDFNTTATAESVDALSATLNGTYAMTRRFQFGSGVGLGRNRFLGGIESGRLDNFSRGMRAPAIA